MTGEVQGHPLDASAGADRPAQAPSSQPNTAGAMPPPAPPDPRWVPVAPAQGYWQLTSPVGMQSPPQPESRPWHRQGWFWLIVAVVGLAVVAVIGIAVEGAIHGLTSATQAQTAAITRQTHTLGGIAAALRGIEQTLQSIGQTMQAISRELSRLVGMSSGHAGTSAAGR